MYFDIPDDFARMHSDVSVIIHLYEESAVPRIGLEYDGWKAAGRVLRP